MNVTIVDYNSGNISSVINSFKEVAQDKVNIEVTSDLNKIKSSDKVVLPGQGSFKSCVDALNKIKGLTDTLNEFAIANKKKHQVWNQELSTLHKKEKFDVITMWDVFEHIKNQLGETLANMYFKNYPEKKS